LALQAARDRTVAASTRYIKRQATWFRNRAIVDPAMTRTINARISEFTQLSEQFLLELAAFINGSG